VRRFLVHGHVIHRQLIDRIFIILVILVALGRLVQVFLKFVLHFKLRVSLKGVA
jgi:hypothetical protein